MKIKGKILILTISLLLTNAVYANINKSKLPTGVFKQGRNGKIIQYDNRGKKIGTYKIVNGKLRKK